jgi:hypothetical protein
VSERADPWDRLTRRQRILWALVGMILVIAVGQGLGWALYRNSDDPVALVIAGGWTAVGCSYFIAVILGGGPAAYRFYSRFLTVIAGVGMAVIAALFVVILAGS